MDAYISALLISLGLKIDLGRGIEFRFRRRKFLQETLIESRVSGWSETETIQLLLNLATTIFFVDGGKGIEIEVVSNSYRELKMK
jgi:hypothetical protein